MRKYLSLGLASLCSLLPLHAEQFKTEAPCFIFGFENDPVEYSCINAQPFITKKGSGLEKIITDSKKHFPHSPQILQIINETYALLKADESYPVYPTTDMEGNVVEYTTPQDIIKLGRARCIGRVIVGSSLFEEAGIDHIVVHTIDEDTKINHVFMAIEKDSEYLKGVRYSKRDMFKFNNKNYVGIEMAFDTKIPFKEIPKVPREIKSHETLAIFNNGEYLEFGPKIKWK